MKCQLLVNTWIHKSRPEMGKVNMECSKTAVKKIIYTKNFSLNACSFHVKKEERRNNKYNLGIIIKDLPIEKKVK